MFGVGEEGAGRSHFRQLSQIHHGDPISQVLDHVQVVRDEQVGQVILGLQILEQVDDLRLNRHVQGRDRFIAHDQLRVQRQGARNADPLALAPGKFMRVPRVMIRPQAHAVEKLTHPLRQIPAFGQVMDLERLAHDGADGHARVQ